MMLSTGHTTSTRMLSVFANTAVAGGDVPAAGRTNMLATRGDSLGAVGLEKSFRLTVCEFWSVA